MCFQVLWMHSQFDYTEAEYKFIVVYRGETCSIDDSCVPHSLDTTMASRSRITTGWRDNDIGKQSINYTVVEDARTHGRLKHVNTKYQFMIELIQRAVIADEFGCSSEQQADNMTKALPTVSY